MASTPSSTTQRRFFTFASRSASIVNRTSGSLSSTNSSSMGLTFMTAFSRVYESVK